MRYCAFLNAPITFNVKFEAMIEKLKEILETARYTTNPLEDLEQELLNLFSVSNRRELLIGLIRKDTDVTISGQFKGRLFVYRQESFLVEYNHNGQCEWISIDDITT